MCISIMHHIYFEQNICLTLVGMNPHALRVYYWDGIFLGTGSKDRKFTVHHFLIGSDLSSIDMYNNDVGKKSAINL